MDDEVELLGGNPVADAAARRNHARAERAAAIAQLPAAGAPVDARQLEQDAANAVDAREIQRQVAEGAAKYAARKLEASMRSIIADYGLADLSYAKFCDAYNAEHAPAPGVCGLTESTLRRWVRFVRDAPVGQAIKQVTGRRPTMTASELRTVLAYFDAYRSEHIAVDSRMFVIFARVAVGRQRAQLMRDVKLGSLRQVFRFTRA